MVPDSEMNLIVDAFGCFLGKHSERLVVKQKAQTVQEVPLFDLEQVLIIAGGISLSSDVIRECAERGIPLHFLSFTGNPYACLISPELTGTVKTRREQLLAFADGRGVTLAKVFVAGKLSNQANLVKYMAKYRKRIDRDLHERVREASLEIERLARDASELAGENVDQIRPHLLNIEGRGASMYWQAIKELLLVDVDWPGRETRGAQDLVNSLLNYGYGVLYTQIQQALILAGLDPYAGYLHVDRAGKPSMVLDLIEEFRQTVVDRTVFSLLNRGTDLPMADGKLAEQTRKMLAGKVLERLEGQEYHEQRKHKLRTVIQCQARHVATFVRGERSAYVPFVSRW